VPGASNEIVNAVCSAMPELKPSISKALAGYGGAVPSVAATLSQATTISQDDQLKPVAVFSKGSAVRGPAVGPPYLALPTGLTNVTTGTSGEVPAGGRNYAAP